MEREQGSEHSESDEDYREPDALEIHRYIVHLCYFQNVHGRCSRAEVDAEDTYKKQGRSTHEHQGQLHGRILLAAASPYSYEKIHRDEGHFVEHEHGKEVDRDEKSEYSHAQEAEPHEELFDIRFHLP